MLVKNIKEAQNLTIDKKYIVIGITTDYEGQKYYDILNDNIILFEHQTKDYFVTIPYKAELFEVLDGTIPDDWIIQKKKQFIYFGRECTYQTFNFLIENKAFFHRLTDGSEPERSFFFHKLNKLYDLYNMDNLLATFDVIPENHLVNIHWPKDALEDWIDPIDGKTYKSAN